MVYQVLARKWRPQVFDDVIGQVHIARALQNAVKVSKVAHAYLFSGPRGVGKTTMARILAKTLNCAEGPTPLPCNRCSPCQEISGGVSVDVLEIDGASNTSVEDIRELREMVKYIPIQGKHKVYIIDEVHMLSNSAFNALLKTLEEPPPHVVFIFATTEPNKIPPTIRSRCQQFQFKKISRRDMVGRLGQIAIQEGIKIGEQEMFLLAKGAEGSMRDALSLLDQVVAYGGSQVRQEDLLTVMGVVNRQQLLGMIRSIQKKDAAGAVGQVQELVDQGHDLRQFCHDLAELVRDLLVFKIAKQPEAIVECPSEEIEELNALSRGFSVEELQWLFSVFAQTYEEIKNFFYPPFMLEMAVVRAARIEPVESIEKILEKVMSLERRLQHSADVISSSASVGPHGFPPTTEDTTGQEMQADGGDPQSKADDPVFPLEQMPARRSGSAGSRPTEMSLEDHTAPLKLSREASDALPVDVSGQWQRVVQRVKAQRPYLASYLDQGLLMSATDAELVIGYPQTSSFFIDLIRKEENLGLITSLLKECFKKSMKFRAVLNTAPMIEEKTTSDIHPVVKVALKILGGEIVDPKSLS